MASRTCFRGGGPGEPGRQLDPLPLARRSGNLDLHPAQPVPTRIDADLGGCGSRGLLPRRPRLGRPVRQLGGQPARPVRTRSRHRCGAGHCAEPSADPHSPSVGRRADLRPAAGADLGSNRSQVLLLGSGDGLRDRAGLRGGGRARWMAVLGGLCSSPRVRCAPVRLPCPARCGPAVQPALVCADGPAPRHREQRRRSHPGAALSW